MRPNAAAAPATTHGKVRTVVDGAGVRTIALDDPDKRNALSRALLDDLLGALEAARADPATRCVVLCSTHPRVFCAGGNLAAFGDDASIIDKHVDNDRFPRLFKAFGELGKPSVCAVAGHAQGQQAHQIFRHEVAAGEQADGGEVTHSGHDCFPSPGLAARRNCFLSAPVTRAHAAL